MMMHKYTRCRKINAKFSLISLIWFRREFIIKCWVSYANILLENVYHDLLMNFLIVKLLPSPRCWKVWIFQNGMNWFNYRTWIFVIAFQFGLAIGAKFFHFDQHSWYNHLHARFRWSPTYSVSFQKFRMVSYPTTIYLVAFKISLKFTLFFK